MALMAKTTLQRLEAGLAGLLFAMLARLPADWSSGLAGGLARTIGPRLKVSDVARRNLVRTFPDKSAAEIETIVAQVWDNLGRVAGEFPHLPWLVANRVEVVGMEHLHALRDDGQPGLFVSAHFGNWEIGCAVARREGLPMALVYRAANNPGIEDLYRRFRGQTAAQQIPKGAEGARALLQTLKDGGHVAILVDQKMNDGIPVPFLGREAMTAPAVGRFAVRFRLPVVPVVIERLAGARFRMILLPPLALPDSGDTRADTLAVMTALNDRIGEWVRANPGQWLWLHKRWPEN